MASPIIYTVTAFSEARIPEYRKDDRWLEGLWGVYASQKVAEKAVFNEIIAEDVENYTILYEDDLNQLSDADVGKYCACGDEVMRIDITYKDENRLVIRSVVSIARCEI